MRDYNLPRLCDTNTNINTDYDESIIMNARAA